MIGGLPPLRDLLDPQPEGSPFVAGAVRIPFDQIETRPNELGPRRAEVRVADIEPYASRAGEVLDRMGRRWSLASAQPASHPEPGRLWSPNAWLEAWLFSAPTVGMALDVACGSGREAVAMAASGWRVTGVDHEPRALELGADLQRHYAPSSRPIEWIAGDAVRLEDLVPDRTYDLITIFRYLDRDLLGTVGNWLSPGGALVVETFTEAHRERFGKPKSPKHLLRSGELPTLLGSDLEVARYEENEDENSCTARVIALKSRR